MPVMALRTASVTVQLALAGSVPAVKVKPVAPAPIAAGRKPTQPAPATVMAPPVATRFGGKLSVSPAAVSVSAALLGLVMTSVSVLSVLGATALGANDFATVTLV